MNFDDVFGSQELIGEAGIPEGSQAEAIGEGAAEIVPEDVSEGTQESGVSFYTDDEIQKLDVFNIDATRISPDVLPKVLKHMGTATQKMVQKQAENARAAFERTGALEKQLQEFQQSTLAKLTEQLATQQQKQMSVAEQAQASQQKKAEEEYVAGLTDESKDLFYRLKATEERLNQVATQQPKFEMPKEMQDKLDFLEKQEMRRIEGERTERIAYEVKDAVSKLPIHNDIKNDPMFIDDLKVRLYMRWSQENAQGLPLSNIQLVANEFASGITRYASYFGSVPNNGNVQSMAQQAVNRQVAPPRVTGTPSQAATGNKTHKELDAEFFAGILGDAMK